MKETAWRCGTPLANLRPGDRLPFFSLILHDGVGRDDFGQVRFVVHTGTVTGAVIEGKRGAVAPIPPVTRRDLTGKPAVRGASLLFAPDYRPVADAPLVGSAKGPG